MTYPGDDRERFASLSDEALFLAYRNGQTSAFDELVARFGCELYNYLRRYIGDPILAEDAFQQTFLQLHVKKHLYQEGRPLRPWLYTIATNQAIDLLRRQKRHNAASLDADIKDGDGNATSFAASLVAEPTDPLGNLYQEEKRLWLRSAVQRLPGHLRAVVIMAYHQGLKQREIAEALNIPVGTVKSRLHAAVQRLGQMWQAEHGASETVQAAVERSGDGQLEQTR